MIKLFLLTLIALTLLVSPVFAGEVVIKAGTEISAVSTSELNTATMSPGDEVNFTLATDVKGVTILIPKGSELFGRVVEVKKFDDKDSQIVLMFDFLKVGEEFYSISALVEAIEGAPNIDVKASDEIKGCTEISAKGAEAKVGAGMTYKLKVINDVTTD